MELYRNLAKLGKSTDFGVVSQDQLTKQITQVGCNLLEPLCQKATQAWFVISLNKHQIKSAVPEKNKSTNRNGVTVWLDWALIRNCNS